MYFQRKRKSLNWRIFACTQSLQNIGANLHRCDKFVRICCHSSWWNTEGTQNRDRLGISNCSHSQAEEQTHPNHIFVWIHLQYQQRPMKACGARLSSEGRQARLCEDENGHKQYIKQHILRKTYSRKEIFRKETNLIIAVCKRASQWCEIVLLVEAVTPEPYHFRNKIP